VSIVPSQATPCLSLRNCSHFGRRCVVFEVQQNSDVTFRLYDWDMWTRKLENQDRSRLIRRCLFDFKGTLEAWSHPRRNHPAVERSYCLIANLFGCGGYSVRPFLLELRKPRVLVCIGVQDRLNMPAFLLQ